MRYAVGIIIALMRYAVGIIIAMSEAHRAFLTLLMRFNVAIGAISGFMTIIIQHSLPNGLTNVVR